MKLDNYSIRRASIGDAPALGDCMKSAYTAYLPRMAGKSLPPLDLDYRDEILNYPTWVIDCDGAIVGGLTMMFDEDAASIANIGVGSDYQGKGLGKLLMDFAERQAGKRHFTSIQLATHILLTENISLYRYLGWQQYDQDDIRVYFRKSIK